MGYDLLALAWPGDPAGLLERRRAEAIVQRVRRLAMLFAALTVAWIAVDALAFPTPAWLQVAAARLAAAAGLVALARSCRGPEPGRNAARLRLALLFAIPGVFHVVVFELLGEARLDASARVMASAYAFMPFVLAAGIGAFPLALAESALLALFALLLQVWTLAAGGLPLPPFGQLDALWLLALIAAVGAFAAASQLDLMAALVMQAIRDPLTGCLRRESGREMLDMQFRLAGRGATPFALLFADIDRFKRVNDELGHEVGDQVLATAATRLGSVLRASDILVRWGGEEFVMALPGSTAAEAEKLIARLRAGGLGRLPDGRAVTMSIGIAEARDDGAPDVEALVDLADQRMYLAKQAGRNRYVKASDGAAVAILG
jgi:diguanylate cyclase (GGDEF)-like protein